MERQHAEQLELPNLGSLCPSCGFSLRLVHPVALRATKAGGVEGLRPCPRCGEGAWLLSQLQMPCAHCGGAFHEPLTMAAKRHRRDPRAVIEAFRALDSGGPDTAGIDAALARVV